MRKWNFGSQLLSFELTKSSIQFTCPDCPPCGQAGFGDQKGKDEGPGAFSLKCSGHVHSSETAEVLVFCPGSGAGGARLSFLTL